MILLTRSYVLSYYKYFKRRKIIYKTSFIWSPGSYDMDKTFSKHVYNFLIFFEEIPWRKKKQTKQNNKNKEQINSVYVTPCSVLLDIIKLQINLKAVVTWNIYLSRSNSANFLKYKCFQALR